MIFHRGAFDVKFHHVGWKWQTFIARTSSRSEIAAFTFPSRTSLANIFDFSSVFYGFCCGGSLFWIVLVLFKRPSTSLYFERFNLFSTWDYVSDVLHLFEVLCNIREGITSKALRQLSRFGDFEGPFVYKFFQFIDNSLSWSSFW